MTGRVGCILALVSSMTFASCRVPSKSATHEPAPPTAEVFTVAPPADRDALAVEEAAGEPSPDAQVARREAWLARQGEARDERRSALELEVARSPGWGLYESEHYLFLSELHDRVLIAEALACAEAQRVKLVQQFPPHTPLGESNHSTSTVVRVFASQSGYHDYGGPVGSSAYYASLQREAVVVLDTSASGAHADALSGLKHILVHEYFREALGLASPPRWLEYGVSEFYAGMRLVDGALVLEDLDERYEPLKARREALVPLSELLRYGEDEFRGANPRGAPAYTCVLQSWSLVLFLQLGAEQSAAWSPAWDDLVERCLEAAASALEVGAQAAAVEQVLASLDLEALEAAWRAWLTDRLGAS